MQKVWWLCLGFIPLGEKGRLLENKSVSSNSNFVYFREKTTCVVYVLRICYFVSVKESLGVLGFWDCEFKFVRYFVCVCEVWFVFFVCVNCNLYWGFVTASLCFCEVLFVFVVCVRVVVILIGVLGLWVCVCERFCLWCFCHYLCDSCCNPYRW